MRTYGTVELKDGAWLIKCEPHVALRLKRVFGKLNQRSVGALSISATPDNARDLEWFIQRYPLDVRHPGDLAAMANTQRDRQALIDALLSKTQTAFLPFDLALPLRDYQKEAVAMVLATRGLLIADDVGVGKTAEAIGIFGNPDTLPAVIVTLTHLTTQWQREIEKFAPHLSTHIIKKAQPYDIATRGRRKRKNQPELAFLPDVLILNYHKLFGWADTFSKLRLGSTIFDECQELRRSDSQRYHAAHLIAHSSRYRVGLSATPIYNHGSEIYNVLECIAPGALGSYSEFSTEWTGSAASDSSDASKLGISKPKAFGSYLRDSGLLIRRTRAEVGRELPGLTIISHAVDADTGALDSVSFSCRELARIILSQGENYRGQKMHASEEFSNQLRQATGIAKAPYVAEFVRLLVESGEKVVLFGWHRMVYKIWLDRLKDLKPVLYTGSESPAQKDAAKDAFVKGDANIFIVSLRAGSGLDGLQHVCRTFVAGELDWSPGVHEQNAGRIARDGQKDPVTGYYMVCDHGADPFMCDSLGLKSQQVKGLRGDSEDMVSKLQTDGGQIRRLAEQYLGISRQEDVA